MTESDDIGLQNWTEMGGEPKDGELFLARRGNFVAAAFYKKNTAYRAVNSATLQIIVRAPDTYSSAATYKFYPTHWKAL